MSVRPLFRPISVSLSNRTPQTSGSLRSLVVVPWFPTYTFRVSRKVGSPPRFGTVVALNEKTRGLDTLVVADNEIRWFAHQETIPSGAGGVGLGSGETEWRVIGFIFGGLRWYRIVSYRTFTTFF